jgi:hypothetical protein
VLELGLLVLELNNTLQQFLNFFRGHTRSLRAWEPVLSILLGPSRFLRLKDAPQRRGLDTFAPAFETRLRVSQTSTFMRQKSSSSQVQWMPSRA